ncbi:MAG: hypothetical protein JST58_07330 [Bacteroidetes bacterium]|nr:hypothetical protein [Bacteroidota bacterium]
MKFKKAISFFLLLVLSIQLLPIEDIIKWLQSGTATEEIAHGSANFSKRVSLDENSKELLPLHHGQSNIAFVSVNSFHLRAEDLINQYTKDIHTPPPNC